MSNSDALINASELLCYSNSDALINASELLIDIGFAMSNSDALINASELLLHSMIPHLTFCGVRFCYY